MMTAEHFRTLYQYHFALNRKIWDELVMQLTDAQFLQPLDYSVGSIRNQTVHMFNIDERWFSGLAGKALPDFLDPAPYTTREMVRARWDEVEVLMGTYLETLTDETLDREFAPNMQVWQVLTHVVNHGTDHRAQLLAMLNGMGLATFAQDYALYLFGRL